jgi:hypothetical protein
LTEVSSTSSPTTTRMPPMRDGSSCTVRLSLRPNRFSSACATRPAASAGDREGAVDDGVGRAALGVLHGAELRRHFGQRGQAAVLDHRAQEVLPAAGSCTRAMSATRSYTCSADLRVPANCSSWALPATAASASSHCDVPFRSFGTTGTGPRRTGGRWWRVRPWLASYSSVCRRWSSSAWTPAFTSLRRICSAPLTASAATCSRRASRALHRLLVGFGAGGGDDLVRLFGRAALGLLDDALGAALGVGQQRRRSRCATWPVPAPRACWRRPVRTWPCRRRPGLRRSCFARSSSAVAIGGHTNFIVNPTRIRNTIT